MTIGRGEVKSRQVRGEQTPHLLEELLSVHALALEPRHAAGVERRGDGRHGYAELRSLLDGPLAGALHAGLVEDLLDERAGLRLLVVLLAEDLQRRNGEVERPG